MGSGPACHLASIFDIGALLLISPLSSVKNVVKSKSTFVSWFVKERFPNIKKIVSIKCPCFIVHGKLDKVIPY